MLGDIQISEPNALIGFAGQRVIENTIREKLPEGFQRAEYLLDHVMIDMGVHRSELRARLSQIISYLCPRKAAALHMFSPLQMRGSRLCQIMPVRRIQRSRLSLTASRGFRRDATYWDWNG